MKEEKIQVKATYFPACVVQYNSGGYWGLNELKLNKT